ncbi:hypothetical protein GS426_19805 [Rhodococcus hoagii]|nr:hypothetical protein [Prescottella equi]
MSSVDVPDLWVPAVDETDASPHLDDLDMVWLHVDSDGQVSEHRHASDANPTSRSWRSVAVSAAKGHWSSAPHPRAPVRRDPPLARRPGLV